MRKNVILSVAIGLFTVLSIGGWASHTPATHVALDTTYVVNEGDTLFNIASRYSESMDSDEFQEFLYKMQKDNHIKDAGSIQPGQVLVVKFMK